MSFTVAYSGTGSVSLSAGNITVNSTGTADASSIVVSGSGATRTVTLSGITGDGTLGISVASGTATDLAGNTAPGAGPSTAFTVDNTVPTVSIGTPSADSTAGDPVSYTVTYSDANFGSATLNAGNITVNSTGTASASTVVVTGSGTTRTVTLDGITGDGTLGISIASGTASDTAGNLAPAAGPGTTFTIIGGPSVTTLGATNVTLTTATLQALVNPNGQTTLAAFESGADTDYGTATEAGLSPVDGNGEQLVSITLTNLSPATTYHFRIGATNGAGGALGSDVSFTTATNLAAPTDILLSAATVAENQPSGTAVGEFTAADADAGDTASYALVSGTGDTDNASFAINGGTLETAASFNYEAKTNYTIRVAVTDIGGLSFEKAFTITVTDINEAPTFSGYALVAPRNTGVTVKLAKVLARTTDPERAVRTVTAADASSAQGGGVQLLADSFIYTPPADYIGADSFALTISDGVNAISATVSVTVGNPTGNGQTLIGITAAGGDVQLRFAGIPGRNYLVEHSTSLDPAATWTTLSTVAADASGFFTYTHSSPPSPSYWRAALVP